MCRKSFPHIYRANQKFSDWLFCRSVRTHLFCCCQSSAYFHTLDTNRAAIVKYAPRRDQKTIALDSIPCVRHKMKIQSLVRSNCCAGLSTQSTTHQILSGFVIKNLSNHKFQKSIHEYEQSVDYPLPCARACAALRNWASAISKRVTARISVVTHHRIVGPC